MKAEGDTTLRGATATADRIDVKTGGTLTIESLQDIAESMSRNSQVGGRVQVSFGTAWNADGYASAGKASGSYQGVGQQSGLFAGNGGYHVDAGHVNLIGGAIASAHAGNSELTAGSLTFTDLQNHMDYTASSGSISGGAGGQMDGWAPKPGTAAPRGGPGLPMMEKGSDSSSTLATLTEGNITIGGKQTSAAELGINTDASGAHRALDALPDANKLLADQQAMAAAAGTVMATSQQIAWDIGSADAKKITDKYREPMSPEERRAFDALRPEEQFKRLVAFDASYPDALATQQKWAPDGVYGRALGAVTSALVGGVKGQGLGQLGSNALAPYAAELIGKTFDPNKQSAVPSEAMQMLSHALLGALLAEANGGKAGSGALAAGGGELAAKFLGDYYAKQNNGQLSPEQAEQVRVLGQAVGAMVGGLSGAGISGATLGMGIAKNSVENNYLNHDERMEYLQATLMCSDSGKDCDIKENFERLSAERDYKLLMACQVPGSIACSEQRSLAKIALESHNSPIYKGEYDAWMAENADKLIAASKNTGSGVNLEKIAIHSSTEDLQRKVYCSLVGECGSNTVDLLRGAGYGAEADWLSSTNRAVAGAAFVNGLWTGGKDLVAGAASMNQIGVLLGLVSDYKEMDKLGLQAFSQKRNSAISQAINEYMEKTAGLAYYLAGGRNSWNFEDVDQAANVGGKLTVDIGSSLLGPEAFLAKGAKTTALEAAASEALERARKARSVKLEPDGSLPPHLLPDNIDGHGLIEYPVLQVPDSSMVAAERLKSDLFELQKVDVRLNTMLPGGGKPIEVIAESSIGGQVLWDTNQGSRPAHLADPNRPTLISDLVPPGRPNSNMKEAHAEIALIQQAFDAGLTRGQDMSMVVRGRSVCDFCMSDIGKAADRAGLNSVRVLDASNGRVHVGVRGIGWK